MKAVIGINVDIEGDRPKKATIQANYYESIAAAGGLPVLIPPTRAEDLGALLERLDGILFIGGADYCPRLYGEEAHPSVELAHDERIAFDYQLLVAALDRQDLPLLGICAGCQILNIGLGGSLFQDIPTEFPSSEIEHTSNHGWTEGFNNHKVIVQAGSRLAAIYSQPEFGVPTSHHQSIKELGAGLVATAYAPDGIIEAVELSDRDFVIGVQWHPERDYKGNRELFCAFVNAAALKRESAGRHAADRPAARRQCRKKNGDQKNR
jgi:putative glutamine amidotransferase